MLLDVLGNSLNSQTFTEYCDIKCRTTRGAQRTAWHGNRPFWQVTYQCTVQSTVAITTWLQTIHYTSSMKQDQVQKIHSVSAHLERYVSGRAKYVDSRVPCNQYRLVGSMCKVPEVGTTIQQPSPGTLPEHPSLHTLVCPFIILTSLYSVPQRHISILQHCPTSDDLGTPHTQHSHLSPITRLSRTLKVPRDGRNA